MPIVHGIAVKLDIQRLNCATSPMETDSKFAISAKTLQVIVDLWLAGR